jgi:hypothetical protein
MGEGPIYITGSSYSGKTQLRLMLSAHPNIVITRRTYMWSQYCGKFGDLREAMNIHACIDAMLTSEHIQALSPDRERIVRELRRGEASYGRLFALIHQHYAERLGKRRWGDQDRAVQWDTDSLLSADPRTTIVHMVRNPIDRLGESLGETPQRRVKLGWETALWRRSARLAARNQEKYPRNYRFLQCEQLFLEPEKTLRELCAFLGEEFTDRMLEVDGLAEMGVVVNPGAPRSQDILRGHIGHGIGQLTPRERAFVRSRTGKEMAALGYPQSSLALSWRDSLGYFIVDYPLNWMGEALRLLWRGATSISNGGSIPVGTRR